MYGTCTCVCCAILYSLQKLFEELEQAQNTSRQLVESKKKLELDLHNTKKQFEAQELVCVCVCVCMCTCTCVCLSL